MYKKTLAVCGIVTIIGGCLVGYKVSAQSNIDTNIESQEVINNKISGKIIRISDKKVDLLIGDIVERFEVSNASDFKEGELVSIKDNKLSRREEVESSLRYTTMGELIHNNPS